MLAVLSRLLLCLCLLADTVGPAMAATHLARVPAADVAGATAATGEDCHAMVTEVEASTVAPDAPAPEDSDCLERCLDLCLQHGVATLPATAALTRPPAGTQATPAPAAQPGHPHAFPALRPPIA